ncbi:MULTISPECIES: YfhE family protein [Planococcus]|uniref:YfhE family protein n=1 Tax=Planococcus wigleyi TaxID=2762216 RepID=A0ABR8WDW6_9BACL|nr:MULTISPECIES: YfhE family protein [Planococcus]MBD8015204.1 YfhE family protein [Planococcus wigleyi]
MSKEKEPHEKLADKELDLKAAQEVHYNDDFKKADNAAKAENQQNESKSEKSDDK